MAFDQSTRNRLARFVSDTRTLLTEEFTRQLQNDYGLDPATGEVTDVARLSHLDDARRETARLLRDTMEHYLASTDTATPAKAKKARQEVLDRILREQAFTVLNRLCALRMAEARGLLIESIAKGYQSKGFQLYQRLAGTAVGETGAAYRLFLFSVFDEFAVDLAVLFDRFSPQGRLFPREAALLAVLEQVNHPDIDPLWAEDETIGWIYQYFNSLEERRQMRAESQAPRNSRELAVRNQFFTPRYVVEFLTDNTLGRIWYEMTKGETGLKDSCRYLVRRPNEIFLGDGREAPESDESTENMSQEELLRHTVHILHRPLKDPRDIRMLDPACGSMHFGLYAFDLFERIYEEAWEIEAARGPGAFTRSEDIKPLTETYSDKNAFLRAVPRLIIERNIHGIDIDPRAVQIAGLSLWLRAQRSWQAQSVKAQDRLQVQRSNIVCAEPMPGESDMLEEFVGQLQPKVLGQLVKIIFEKMELAGEAGSLLKIEEDIKDAIADAHKEYQEFILREKKGKGFLPGMAPEPQATLFDFADLPKEEDFWHTAEQRVVETLRAYAETATANSYQRRLFAHDAARGFAFIDICRNRYDVALMNPPFGLIPVRRKTFFQAAYPDDWTEIYACFITRMLDMISRDGGFLGAITSSLWLYTKHQHTLRLRLCTDSRLDVFADLGGGVLDSATVDTGLLVAASMKCAHLHNTMYLDSHGMPDESRNDHIRTSPWSAIPVSLYSKLPLTPFCFHVDLAKIALWSQYSQLEPSVATVVTGNSTFDNFRFLRLHFEVEDAAQEKPREWIPYDKGGHFQPFFNPTPLLWNFANEASENCAFQIGKYGTDAQVKQSCSSWLRSGLCYSRATSIGFSPRLLPADSVMNEKSISVFPHRRQDTLPLLAVLASTHIQDLLDVFGRHRNIENRAVGGLPLDKQVIATAGTQFERLALQAIHLVWRLEAMLETSPVFTRPPFKGESLPILQELCDLYTELDERAGVLLYGEPCSPISPARSELVMRHLGGRFSWDCESAIYLAWLSYSVGVAFGRWKPEVNAEVFPPDRDKVGAPLPQIPPAKAEGLGLAVDILVDDPGHPRDICAVCEGVAHGIVQQLRERNPNDVPVLEISADFLRNQFFDYHIGMCSVSARQAPLYWPLSTPSGSYTLWLYYHRMTDQTLYTCVLDFVEPKLKQVADEAARLRTKTARSSAEEKDLERLSNLELELKDFRDELLRIARFWKPNLNDGVQITAAPLWRLFQHRQWQARLRETWEKLEAGDYDWAHLALSVWPDRVVRASHKDRSYAIAHDLEDRLWHEVKVEKVGRGGRVTTMTEWQPRDLTEADLKSIVAEVQTR